MSDKSLRTHVLDLLSAKNAHVDFSTAIAGLAAGKRGARPKGSPHSPWEIVEHIRIAQWDILEFCRDAKHKSPDWPSGYWPKNPAPRNAAAWAKSLKAISRSLAEMKKLVASAKTESLCENSPRLRANNSSRSAAPCRSQRVSRWRTRHRAAAAWRMGQELTPVPQNLERPTFVRWQVMACITLVTMLTYLDRLNLGIAAKFINDEFHFSTQTMGWILSAFVLGYSVFQIPGGWLGDRLGPRNILAGAIVLWSIFTALTALAPRLATHGWISVAWAFIAVRFLVGAGEAATSPNGNKIVANWMGRYAPRHRRELHDSRSRHRRRNHSAVDRVDHAAIRLARIVLFRRPARIICRAALVRVGYKFSGRKSAS